MADTLLMTTAERLKDQAIRKMNGMPNRILEHGIREMEREIEIEMRATIRAMQDSVMLRGPFVRMSPFDAPWANRGSVAELGPAPTPPIALAIKAPVGEIDPELLAHEALAKKLGITCVAPEIGVQRLRQVLAEEGITCYDRKAVEDYLTVMAARAQAEIKPGQWGIMSWGWFPARKVDVSLPKVTGEASTVYDSPDHPIPLPALMTMDRIVGCLGDQVRFLVGAITKGDPFLAVVARGSDVLFPFERWSEPSFRGVKA